MTENEISLAKQWLSELGALEEFETEYIKDKSRFMGIRLCDCSSIWKCQLMADLSLHRFVYGGWDWDVSFIWDKTNKGFNYWNSIHGQLKKKYAMHYEWVVKRWLLVLKKRGLLEKYMINFYGLNWLEYETRPSLEAKEVEDVTKHILSKSNADVIKLSILDFGYNSFQWEKSLEGYGFWSNVFTEKSIKQ